MMKFFSCIYIFTIWLCSCMPDDNLPIKNVGEVPEYFIECYCKPGLPFVLSATTVMPISQKLVADFSREMSVYIKAEKDMKLNHQLFQLPGSDFIYNYGCEEVFHPTYTDSLSLHITASGMSEISATTLVPPAVQIHSCKVTNTNAYIYIEISRNPDHNYYIYYTEFIKNGDVIGKEVRYLDYSQQPAAIIVEKDIPLPDQDYDKVIFNLKRITKENYLYQLSLNAANTANQSSITTPVPLKGNIRGALGIFTCYTEDQYIINVHGKY